MNSKEKFELEYNLSTSLKFLFNMLSTSDGLAKWFASKVDITNKTVTFFWKDSQQKAEIISQKLNELIRFRWLDSEPDAFFEFKIHADELTGNVSMIITDFAFSDEKDDAIFLWEDNIKKLKRAIGMN